MSSITKTKFTKKGVVLNIHRNKEERKRHGNKEERTKRHL